MLKTVYLLTAASGIVLAQQGGPIPPADPTGGWGPLAGVVTVAVSAIAAFWALIKHYTTEIKEITGKFERSVSEKDRQIIDLGHKFDATVKEQGSKFETLFREIRTEHADTVTKQFAMSRDLILAVEHVTKGLEEVKQELKTVSRGAARDRSERQDNS